MTVDVQSAGAAAAGTGAGLGLMGMRERAESVGGTCSAGARRPGLAGARGAAAGAAAGGMIRLLVVDDQDLVRAGLRGILHPRYGLEVVGECADGAEVPAAVRRLRPDVVVMDVRMPGVDGVARHPAGCGSDPDAPPGARAHHLRRRRGAGRRRCARARPASRSRARRRRTCSAPSAASPPARRGSTLPSRRGCSPPTGPHPPRRGADPRLATLTAREREVLERIGRGLSNAEIAAEFVLGEGTVKTHVNHVFAKLQLRDRAAAVVFAFDSGLVRPGAA